MTGKIMTREWTRRGPTGRRVKRTSYGYDVTVNGHRERRICANWQTPTEAMEAMLARRRELEVGTIDRPADRTLSQLADEYLAYKEQAGKRSLREDRRILKTRVLPAFGVDVLVRRLSGAMIAQYEKRRAGQVSPFTVANDLTVLRHMLRLGRRWGYLDQVPEIEMPKKPEGRRRYLEEDEIARLLAACHESKNLYLHAIVTIALNTGMRKQEILGLEWERINFSNATITLYKTKSGKPRGIPILQPVYEALVGLEPDSKYREGRVFRRRDGTAWGQVRTAFMNALSRARIKAFRFHDLRHTFASHFVMRGGSLKTLQEILGHSDYKMTQRYAHLSPAHLRADMERMDGLTPSVTAHSRSQSAKMGGERPVSPCAPVAQTDRAAVS